MYVYAFEPSMAVLVTQRVARGPTDGGQEWETGGPPDPRIDVHKSESLQPTTAQEPRQSSMPQPERAWLRREPATVSSAERDEEGIGSLAHHQEENDPLARAGTQRERTRRGKCQ
jgi:hypothetical protein